MSAFTTSELMVAAGANELKDGQLVVVGLGIPQIAAALAQRTHAPRLRALHEMGVVDPRPLELGVGNADPRIWYEAAMLTGSLEIMGAVLQRGLVDVGFLGALEVDRYGNANSTEVPRPDGTIRRFNGSGGANDMAALAKTTIIIVRHEPRKLVERVSHLTSAGFLSSANARQAAGLPGGGPSRVLTDKAVFGFNKSQGTLELLSIHLGVSQEDVRANTGFALDIPPDCPTTAAPTEEQLRIIREELDPDQQYTVRP